MLDYTICYREYCSISDSFFAARSYDFFWAALTDDDRSRVLYEKVGASTKRWLVLPEYGYNASDIPTGSHAPVGVADEAEFIRELIDSSGLTRSSRICIDITGLLAPYLLFLLRALVSHGIVNIEVVYAEPGQYLQSEETKFSGEDVRTVRQVYGFEGSHIADTAKDILILGAGYDHQLLKMVATAKEGARAIQLFGLPALRPDMYQQNILRANRAADALGRGAGAHQDNFLVPAHDPFTTASFLSSLAEEYDFTNLYLCPLATKAQVLGFGIFYITECVGKAVSILYPFCGTFPRKTSVGIGRIWIYTAELDLTR